MITTSIDGWLEKISFRNQQKNMPSRRIHKIISKMILGDDHSVVHAALDYPVRYFGPRHRKYFHDPISAFLVGYFLEDVDGGISALSHISTDYIVTSVKKYLNSFFS